MPCHLRTCFRSYFVRTTVRLPAERVQALPPALKERIAGLKAIHAMTHSSSGEPRKGFETVTDVSHVPGPHHPTVRTHPDT